MTKKHKKLKMTKKDVWRVSTIVLGVLLLISLFTSGFSSLNAVSEDVAVEKAVSFINANLLQPGTTAQLVEVTSEGGLYNLHLDIGGRTYNSFITKDAKILCPSAIPLEAAMTEVTGSAVEQTSVDVEGINTFSATGDELCTENGKPVVRLFTTTWCPHCTWIKDTYDSVVKEYVDSGKIVAYHWEVDTGDNTLTTDVETDVPELEMGVYRKYNPGGSIPTFVFGCEYSRTGNGYEGSGTLADEEAEFRAVIEDLLA
ncbi:hypothetical protein ACFLZ7_01405 [Nanoarchaeota archaeon]